MTLIVHVIDQNKIAALHLADFGGKKIHAGKRGQPLNDSRQRPETELLDVFFGNHAVLIGVTIPPATPGRAKSIIDSKISGAIRDGPSDNSRLEEIKRIIPGLKRSLQILLATCIQNDPFAPI